MFGVEVGFSLGRIGVRLSGGRVIVPSGRSSKLPQSLWGLLTQRVHIYYHYGITSQKTIHVMVSGT